MSARSVLITALSALIVAFHLATATTIVIPGYLQAAVHFCFISCIIILTRPFKFKLGFMVELFLCLVIAFVAVYQIWLQQLLSRVEGVYSSFDIAVAILCFVLALYLGFRTIGWILPVICILFTVYALFGHNLTGYFTTSSFSVKRIFSNLFTSTDGMFGSTLMVSARFLLLFIFFGTLMDVSGSGSFYVNLADSVAGRARGGPAQAAVYSSMLMGMVNGSGPANVAVTGTFTIPLMKKTGYQASVAGAVEAVASTGGQIMPPVMGAVAFLMSDVTGIPYVKIATAAFVPAMLYYLTLSFSIYGFARRQKMEKVAPSTLPKIKEVFRDGWFYLIPMLVIIVMVFRGYSPQRAAIWTIAVAALVTLAFKRGTLTLNALLDACRSAAKIAGPLAIACMLAGIVMCTINITSLGLKISSIINMISHGSLIITLLLAMLAALVLGMGLPTSAAYIVLSVLIVPAMLKMDVKILPAHMFILYFGILSGITPPVALSTFTASGISGAGIWETGWEAIKLAAAGFIVPFIFVYNNELLLMGAAGDIAFAIITALLGCAILGFSISGWCFTELPILSRLLLILCAVSVIIVDLTFNIIGIVAALAVILVTRQINMRKTHAQTT
ncbi:MAG: TRAP transporter fused permease subunit [Synergistaceae bacterium]|nr:TRAP transporter fused permease subunit [Synergistaceae bacterium]